MWHKNPKNIHHYNEIKDYVVMTLGLFCYSFGWALFFIPYKITTGGTTGIGAIIYYATGFPIQITYFLINAVLMVFAFIHLGKRFCIRTSYNILVLTFALWFCQKLVNGPDGTPPLILGEGQDFMACIIGSVMAGFGLGIVFNSNGSTGGTDIIAAIANKYRDISLGRMIQVIDVFIVSSCFFVFHDWRRVIFGFVAIFFIGYMLDYVVNSVRQSVQFFIFSKKYDIIATRINSETHRGVTVIDGIGWYKKQDVKVLIVLAYKNQSAQIFQLIKSIDPNAFISQSAVIGVFGEGFDKIKGKVKKDEELPETNGQALPAETANTEE